MANAALQAVIGGTSEPLRRELEAVRRMAAQTGVDLKASIEGAGHVRSGAIRETLVLMREISRGNWNRVPGSFTLLLQQTGLLGKLFKGTSEEAKALAAAQTAAARAAAQAANEAVLEAEANFASARAARLAAPFEDGLAQATHTAALAKWHAAEASKAEALATLESAEANESATAAVQSGLTPLAAWALGIIAVGTAAFFLVRHLLTLEREAKNLADLTDTNNVKFSEQASAMKKAAEDAQGFSDWLGHLADNQGELAEKTETAIKAIREQAKYERELAQARGASKDELAKMEVETTQKELDTLIAAKLQLKRNLELDKIAASEAEKNANDPQRAARIGNLGSQAQRAARLVDAIQEAMKTAQINEIIGHAPTTGVAIERPRPANENDLMSVNLDSKEFKLSLNQAKAAFDKITKEENELAAIQKHMNDLLQEKKKLTEADNAELKRLSKQADDLKADLDLQKKYLPQIAGASSERGRPVHGRVSNLQQVGAYTTGAVDVQRQSLQVLHKIAHNTEHLGNGKPESGGGGGEHVHF